MTIKFLTLNIWRNNKQVDNAVKFLQKENPDIINLQEVYNGTGNKIDKRFRTLEILKEKLDHEFHNFAPAFRDISEKERVDADSGNAVFSRFPIKAAQTIFFDSSYGVLYDPEEKPEEFPNLPRLLQRVVVEFSNFALNIYNVHGPWNLRGEKDTEKRLKMSEIITKEVANKNKVILAGDFNVRPQTKTIKNIEVYLKNVFKNGLETTFNMKYKTDPGYATAVVDMVFVSPDIQVVEYYCPQVDISDHLPLIAVFDI